MPNAIASLLAAIALIACGFGWGYGTGQSGAAKAQAAAVAEAVKEHQAQVQRGTQAVAAYRGAFSQMASDFQALKDQFNDLHTRVPLLVPRACPAGQVGRRPATALAAAPSAGTPAAPGQATTPQTLPADLVPAGGADALSAGAVWMWNSALAGADMPAGACGAADTSTAACALDTGITLDAAWANHAANAQACAVDRLRYQRLIDFLNGRAP